jgi:hypothetical protein
MGAAVRQLVLPWRAAHGRVSLVILLEVIPVRCWQDLPYNKRALLILAALLFGPSVIVTAVPYHLER